MWPVLRAFLFCLSPEWAHHIAFTTLRWITAIPGVQSLVRRWGHGCDSGLTVRAMGYEFPNPIGLAAGFDKNAEGYEALGVLGFGFIEVGTVTPHPQLGNPQPRLFRLPKDRALINRMGFNNCGAVRAATHFTSQRQTMVGINIGKMRTTPQESSAVDYADAARAVALSADYLVVNVSSPNTPGLRQLQGAGPLRTILENVQTVAKEFEPKRQRHLPILVKIAPDLADQEIDMIADLVVELGIDGIVATNTTVSREGLCTDATTIQSIGDGGLSGAPLAPRALAVLQRLRARVGTKVVLIAAGGIETAEDAWRRICAGATLVQVYTAFIYAGPTLPRRMCNGLRHLLREHGFTSLQDAIGSDCIIK